MKKLSSNQSPFWPARLRKANGLNAAMLPSRRKPPGLLVGSSRSQQKSFPLTSKRLKTCSAENSVAGTRSVSPLSGASAPGLAPRSKSPASSDFAQLKGLRLLVLVDDDNLRISVEKQKRRLSYRALLAALYYTATICHPSQHLTLPCESRQI